jgi:hypothetical protein
MQLKKHSFNAFNEFYDSFSFFTKIYRKDGLIESESLMGYYSEFEYDMEGKLLVIFETVHIGGDEWDRFFKKEYKYENLTTRIFKYKIGYTNFRDVNNYNEITGKFIEPPIYELNELIGIEENIYNEKSELISKKVNFKETFNINTVKEPTYYFNNNILESYLFENAISYLKYDDFGNIIEINCFKLIEDLEVFYSKTVLEYESQVDSIFISETNYKVHHRLVNVHYKASDEVGNFFDDQHHFYSWESIINKDNKSKLPLSHMINPNYDYYKEYEIKFEYNLNNEIIKTSLKYSDISSMEKLNDIGEIEFIKLNRSVEEKKFFVYKHIESIVNQNNSESNIGENMFVEYIDGFTIIDNELEHMFTHKFEYFT